MENAQFGIYDTSDSFSSGNMFIGKGARQNASIRNQLADTTADSMIYPDTTNGGFVIMNALEVKARPTNTNANITRNYTNGVFSVVGQSYLGNTELQGDVVLGYNSSDTITFNGRVNSHVLPSTSATYDLGSTSYRWNNIYTTDLQLSNIDKDKGNDVDGTRGDWTLQEGDENLYVINNICGKKYKIALIPMDDKDE